MRPQLSNQILTSFKFYLENKLLTKGLAYTNTSGHFYPVHSNYTNYYAYAAPFQPIIADRSIPGATIMSGVYLDNIFITTGQSGLMNIDYEKGIVYFNSGIVFNRISGNYSFADYNVKLTSESDVTLLFEEKYKLKPKVYQITSGIQPYQTTYPIIYLRDNGGFNKPFAFGGLDTTLINVRTIVLADSAYLLDATSSIIKDLCKEHVPLLSGNEFPYNLYGDLRTGYYNYTGLVENRVPNNAAFIQYIDISKFLQNTKTDVKVLPDNVYVGFIDVGLEMIRYPRA